MTNFPYGTNSTYRERRRRRPNALGWLLLGLIYLLTANYLLALFDIKEIF